MSYNTRLRHIHNALDRSLPVDNKIIKLQLSQNLLVCVIKKKKIYIYINRLMYVLLLFHTGKATWGVGGGGRGTIIYTHRRHLMPSDSV